MSFEKIAAQMDFVLGILVKSASLETDWHAVAAKHGISNANHRSVELPFVAESTTSQMNPFLMPHRFLGRRHVWLNVTHERGINALAA